MRLKRKISKQVFDHQDQERAYLALSAAAVCPPPLLRGDEEPMAPRQSEPRLGGRERRPLFWLSNQEDR